MTAWRSAYAMAALTALSSSIAVTASAQRGGNTGAGIDRVRDGTVRMTYAARAGVCGDGMNWYRSREGSYTGSFMNSSWGRDVEVECQQGPVRVVVVRRDNETREIRTYVGGRRWRSDAGVTDLGNVPAREAAQWLVAQAETGPERIASSALSAATLADSTDATAMLLRIVTDERRPQNVRASALSWLGESVGQRVSARLDSIAYEPGDREVRRQAISALGRRPVEESVPSLLRMVETLPDRELRREAVMALARTKDPRAIEWITKQVEGR